MSDARATGTPARGSSILPYLQIMRVDHWFKNLFMVLGIVLACFQESALISWHKAPDLVVAILSACIVASSNYVLNEILDAPTDREHPIKKDRPVASGRVNETVGYIEWLVLGAIGIGIGFWLNLSFGCAAAALWVMGVAYNVRPVRTKELPYLDVISESVNNPIRLLMGWFALIPELLPSLSLLLSYWALGAFFMASKRFAELRAIGDRTIAAAYRKSFHHYTEERLLVSMLFYACGCALMGGVFIVRYHAELILSIPLLAGLLAWYLALSLKKDSPVQNPERLYKEKGFLIYTVLSFLVFVVLMFTRIPAVYEFFLMDPPAAQAPLWEIR